MADTPENPGTGGSTGGEWRSQLKGDLQGNEFFNQYQTVSDLGKWSLDAQGKLKDAETKLNSALFVPGDDAKPEDVAAFYSKLGRPESPDKYDLKKPTYPDGIPYDEAGEKWFREAAHGLGLNGKQAQALFDKYHERVLGDLQAIETKRAEAKKTAEATLRGEWGDKYDENIALVGRALKKFGNDEFVQFVDQSGLGNNPMMLKVFHNIAAAMSEDSLVTGEKAKEPRIPGQLSYPSMKD